MKDHIWISPVEGGTFNWPGSFRRSRTFRTLQDEVLSFKTSQITPCSPKVSSRSKQAYSHPFKRSFSSCRYKNIMKNSWLGVIAGWRGVQ
jgi:hypothetical protein